MPFRRLFLLPYSNILRINNVNTIIRYFRQKINSLQFYLERRDVVVVIVIISLAVTGFALGYQAGSQKTVPTLTIKDNICIQPITEASIKNGENAAQGNNTIVASKNGSRYYFIWCSGASRISAKNKVYFATVEEAKKKGYAQASGCN